MVLAVPNAPVPTSVTVAGTTTSVTDAPLNASSAIFVTTKVCSDPLPVISLGTVTLPSDTAKSSPVPITATATCGTSFPDTVTNFPTGLPSAPVSVIT